MTSVLRTLQAEWNTLVPAAQARGIRRVRLLNAPLETIAYRRAKLEWLRSQLGTVDGFDSLSFGIEIECILPDRQTHSTIAAAIQAAGVPCSAEHYNHTVRQGWKVVTDGSLGDYRRGAEIVSPILRGEDGFAQMRKVCDALVSVRARVNRRCGFHVHVGAQTMGITFFKNLIKLYASAEDAIDSFMSPSRRQSENDFCRSLKIRVDRAGLERATNLGQVAMSIGQTVSAARARDRSRYCKLNLQSFGQHGTVEFRHHQGTIEAVKAENWTRLCLRMCLTAIAGEKTVSSVEDLMAAVDASDIERSYFASRVVYFQRQVQRTEAARNFESYTPEFRPPVGTPRSR